MADNEAVANDFTRAWARYEVGSYANYGKTMAPIVAQQVQFLHKITVSGNCDQTAATNCLNTFYHSNMNHMHETTMKHCIHNTAHCTTDWDSMTHAQRQAFATRYHTNVAAAHTAYNTLWNNFMSDLETAQAAHQTRQNAINADFMSTLNTVAGDMGCDNLYIRLHDQTRW